MFHRRNSRVSYRGTSANRGGLDSGTGPLAWKQRHVSRAGQHRFFVARLRYQWHGIGSFAFACKCIFGCFGEKKQAEYGLHILTRSTEIPTRDSSWRRGNHCALISLQHNHLALFYARAMVHPRTRRPCTQKHSLRGESNKKKKLH